MESSNHIGKGPNGKILSLSVGSNSVVLKMGCVVLKLENGKRQKNVNCVENGMWSLTSPGTDSWKRQKFSRMLSDVSCPKDKSVVKTTHISLRIIYPFDLFVCSTDSFLY